MFPLHLDQHHLLKSNNLLSFGESPPSVGSARIPSASPGFNCPHPSKPLLCPCFSEWLCAPPRSQNKPRKSFSASGPASPPSLNLPPSVSLQIFASKRISWGKKAQIKIKRKKKKYHKPDKNKQIGKINKGKYPFERVNEAGM